jgi:non-canonical poly(A) RNA polymerase PAPD5/7
MPPLRPLTFVLKYFLAARGLNEPYSGGAGSFMLQLLIVAFLQHRERYAYNYHQHTVYNLGLLLLEFLQMYGLNYNYATTGISVRNDGFFFPKAANDRKALFLNPQRPFLMALENPLDPSHDVGKASFRVQMIQRAFSVAYHMLLAHVCAPFEPTPSILGTILPVNQEMLERQLLKKRDRPLASKRGRHDSRDDDRPLASKRGRHDSRDDGARGKHRRWR